MQVVGVSLIIVTLSDVINHCLGVHWRSITRPIVFNEDVKLMCYNDSYHTPCNQCTQRWYGGKNLDVLTVNNVSTNELKYGVTNENDGYELIIKGFEKEDANIIYECAFGYDTQKKNLTLPSDYEKHPNNKTFSKAYSIDKNNYLHIKLQFDEVHPMPVCNASVNGVIIVPSFQKQSSKNNIFLNVSFYLYQKLGKNTCKGTLAVRCSIGTYALNVFKSNTISQCKNQKHTDMADRKLILGVFLSLILVAMFTYYLMWLFNPRFMMSNSNYLLSI